MVMHTVQQLQWQNIGQIFTHEHCPIPGLMGELGGAFHDLYTENSWRYIKNAL